MRSRCLLHKTRLEEFRDFCASQGWVLEPTKGDYEVLRMRHKDVKEPLMVHEKSGAKEHLTTWGYSQKWVQKFLRNKPKESIAQ